MMTMANNADEALANLEVETEIERIDSKAVALLNRSEVEAQIDAAHRHPRSVKKFINEALALATLTREVAESCIYSVPRAGKPITGPSVRLAEICASAYGNLHAGTRVVDIEEKVVVAQGVAWDLQKNLRVSVEVRRRITDSRGHRFNDDMITVTGNAAASIALRNGIFRVVPRAYVDMIYAKVKDAAVGTAMTFAERRAEVIVRLGKMGVPQERIFLRLGKAAVDDVSMEDVETLIGLGTAIKSGDVSIDAAFPPVQAAVSTPATRDLESKLKEHVPEPAPKPARDFVAEAASLKEAITEASGKPKALAEIRKRFEAFSKEAPSDVADDVMRFFIMTTGEQKKAAREPGEEG